MSKAFAVSISVIALVAASCGGTEADPPASPSPDAQPESGLSVAESDLGTILVDGQGHTLYLFANDIGGPSTCYNGCEQTWPPFTQDLLGEPGPGVDVSLLGTAARSDGSVQVTYNSHPLYHHIDDLAPGDINGHGIGDVWFAVTGEGKRAEQMAIPGY